MCDEYGFRVLPITSTRQFYPKPKICRCLFWLVESSSSLYKKPVHLKFSQTCSDCQRRHQWCGVLLASANCVDIQTLVNVLSSPTGYSSSSSSLSFAPFSHVGCWSRPHSIYSAFKVWWLVFFYNSHIIVHWLFLVPKHFFNHFIIVRTHCSMRIIYKSLSVYTIKFQGSPFETFLRNMFNKLTIVCTLAADI